MTTNDEASGAAHDPREGRQYMDCRECGRLGRHTHEEGCVFYAQSLVGKAQISDVNVALIALTEVARPRRDDEGMRDLGMIYKRCLQFVGAWEAHLADDEVVDFVERSQFACANCPDGVAAATACPDCGHRTGSHTFGKTCDVCAVIRAVVTVVHSGV